MKKSSIAKSQQVHYQKGKYIPIIPNKKKNLKEQSLILRYLKWLIHQVQAGKCKLKPH